ncbi:MAG TPA: glycine cleavage system aminomethyltransferase GcvT [Leptospiraceae bacterium]|nr:glycine cleavage system aminomethyltransferase GcvT [Leptospiraceae bacterium]HNF14599.1 glycine cleavage system aminomethyltransferase GcvT [Leptospiraceae bacterium]HNF24802.1 glycine cleavage system aminomethyltransferase GcvT [Leptospiraceae bacterium]HNI94948.1 glycine cleavage system aminomethyltransferase GcvT [Leptospiraceae bacterium]HNM03557.1 glycine cleavage system aminomethyltransferase GcvT [Leptospiraceae bacterium]
MKKTPLNEIHKKSGAKMVPFGGWDMPVQYTGIIQEHLATREAAGLFDVSHMGEIFLEGSEKELLELLERLTCNTVSRMHDGQVQYNAVVNENGGLVDDITVYRFSAGKFMICSNASNYEKVYEHFLKYNSSSVQIRNESSSWHQIAIQGPKADHMFSDYIGQDISHIKYYHFAPVKFRGEEMIVSRTGYTGENGFEIYSSVSLGLSIWSEILEMKKKDGLVPVGLGARDTLRLEAKYPLYGHELNETRTPVESGIGWIVKEKDAPYLGYDRIINDKKNGAKVSLYAMILKEPGVLRENFKVFDGSGNEIGLTTSGSYSPSLRQSIALAVLRTGIPDGTEVFAEIRGEKKKAAIHQSKFIPGSVKK